MDKCVKKLDTFYLYDWSIGVPGTYIDDCILEIITLILDSTKIQPVYKDEYVFSRNKYGVTWVECKK